ncbi:MAG: hypothetical protein LJE68_17580 [Rhodobacter sp.]|nr:hypothetical protein [Rhodobacter sp.]
MSRALFNEALDAARLLWQSSAVMRGFTRWPDDLILTRRKPVRIRAIAHLQARAGTPGARTARLHNTIIALAPHVEWRHTYSEAEVGAVFLAGTRPKGKFAPGGARCTARTNPMP